jgi:hypothetical protein
MKYIYTKYLLYSIIILCICVIVYFFYDFYNRTLVYKNYLKDCKGSTFCGIKVIDIHLPHEYRYKLLDLAKHKGMRIDIPKKRQKNISYNEVSKAIYGIESWYTSISYTISNVVGEKVIPLTKEHKNRLSLIVYDKEGDYIDWHFDTNHFNGRYFTLLVPITFEKTCGNYVYKDKNENESIIELEKNQAILFEGDKVFHSGKPLCKNQLRAILSMTFITNNEINSWNYTMNSLKQFGIFGNQ